LSLKLSKENEERYFVLLWVKAWKKIGWQRTVLCDGDPKDRDVGERGIRGRASKTYVSIEDRSADLSKTVF
jgi:hypothetical protein